MVNKHFGQKQLFFVIFVVILCILIFPTRASAADSVDLNANDYELVCTYNDGAELTISKNGVYLINTSMGDMSTSSQNIKFYLKSDQQAYFSADGQVLSSNYASLLQDLQCPKELYIYKLAAADDENATDEEKDAEIDSYYYSVDPNVAMEVAGPDCGFLNMGCWFGNEPTEALAKKMPKTAILVSEEAYLITSKVARVCYYQFVTTGSYSITEPVTMYIFENMAFFEIGNRLTPLHVDSAIDLEKNDCKTGTLLVNDPLPKPIADNGVSTNYYYNAVRFYVGTDSKYCKSHNNNTTCRQIEYIGSVEGNPNDANEEDVCQTLGNNTITLLANVFKWLQIIVPVLVIILISIDITKMVLSGNLQEELPKKKRSIIIRLIVMVMFFFTPVIATLIIKLLNAVGVDVGIGSIECFIKLLELG